jgi:uncharacterized protein YacL (UPF0231 family)
MVRIQKKLSRKQLKRNITKRSRANRIKRGGNPVYNIMVKTLDQKNTYNIQVAPMDTVRSLKKYYCALTNKNIDEQRITYYDRQLKDGDILSEFNIRENSTVYVADISELFTITVATLEAGPRCTPLVHPLDNVLTLKNNIYDTLGMPTGKQRIKFKGRELYDEEILSLCGIQEGSIVYVANTSDLFNVNLTAVDQEESHTMRFHRLETIETLKNYIYYLFGINFDEQRITFNDRELDDEEILSDCGIQQDSTVYVADISDLFTITVTRLDQDRSYEPKVHPMDTVLTLKNNIYDWYGNGMPIENQRITFNGRELYDEEILSECGIQEGLTVYVANISELFTITATTVDREASDTLRVHPSDTIETLKNNIYDYLGMPIGNQHITFNRRELYDDEILSECGIQEGSTVYVANTSDLISITVTTADQEAPDTLRVHPSETVLTLKNNIYDYLGMPIGNQRITFNGRELYDAQILSECGIQEGSTVYVANI